MPVEELEAPAEVQEPAETVEETSEGGDQVENEQPEEVEGEPAEETEESEEGEEEPEEGLTPEQQEQRKEDGRKMPAGLKSAIASLKKTAPEQAKEVQRLYWSEKSYKDAFPKPEDAIAAKNTLAEIGGVEGIQAINEERQEFAELDRMYSEGSRDFVKSIAESNPEAFQKTAAHVINEFAERSPEQYAYYANAVALNTMKSIGLDLNSLANVYNKYHEENPQLAQLAKEIYEGVSGLQGKNQEFEQKRTNPEADKLKREREEFENTRRGEFEKGIADDAESFLSKNMQPALEAVINGRNVDPEAMKGYQRLVKEAIEAKFAAIPGIEGKIDRFYATGDKKAALDWIQAQYERFIPEAAKVIEPYLRNINPGKKTVPAPSVGKDGKPVQKSADPGSVRLREQPDNDAVDWTKTTVADMLMGKAVLTNGKRATW